MRHFTIACLTKPLDRNELAARVDPTPAPFPGSWPTRIAWKAVTLNGSVHSYVGKPDVIRVAEFQRLCGNAPLIEASFEEFDRKHRQIYSWRLGKGRGTSANTRLFTIYHPWDSCTRPFGLHLGQRFYRHRLDRHWFYAPFRGMTPARSVEYRMAMHVLGV